jgi:putative transposase
MPRYVRAAVPGGTFFFTVALLERRRRLLVEHVEMLREAFCAVRRPRSFAVEAIVILPNHLHCIWTLPSGDADFSTRWRLIKTAFVRQIPRGEPLSVRRQRTGERGIWQRRFWEHAIRDEADCSRYADYIYSSFHRYVARGIFLADWAAAPAVRDWNLE